MIWRIKRSILLCALSQKRRHSKTSEIHKSYGNKHIDKTFYVIGVDEGWCGLFAIVVHQLTHIAYAVEKGYTPIVDLKNYFCQYVSFDDRYLINPWINFFGQPCGYDLEDIKHAKKVIYSVSYFDPPDKKYLMPYETTIYEDSSLEYWSIMFKKYIKINEHVRQKIEENRSELFKNKERVLGVMLRGTDYLTLKPRRHPIQPSIDEAIEKVNQALKDWKCNYIYLATEDSNIYSEFEKYFGNILIIDNSKRWSEFDLKGGKSNSNLFITTEEKTIEGIKYLSQIYLLSKCTSFIAGNTRGSLGVLLMNEGFENKYIFNLGLYP